jgi:hypothetical protein
MDVVPVRLGLDDGMPVEVGLGVLHMLMMMEMEVMQTGMVVAGATCIVCGGSVEFIASSQVASLFVGCVWSLFWIVWIEQRFRFKCLILYEMVDFLLEFRFELVFGFVGGCFLVVVDFAVVATFLVPFPVTFIVALVGRSFV